MRNILVYADSLTWGIIPNTRDRLPFDERWPGVLEGRLNQLGQRVRIVEDCLNGRCTVGTTRSSRPGMDCGAWRNASRANLRYRS